jgi:hypothetical protein
MGGGIPIASARDNITLLPGQVGGTLHLLTRSTVDPFLGGDAGMAIALNKEHGTKLIPYVSGSLGARIYLTNFLMFQLEGGYQFMSYGGYGHFTNLNGPFATAMGGFSF